MTLSQTIFFHTLAMAGILIPGFAYAKTRLAPSAAYLVDGLKQAHSDGPRRVAPDENVDVFIRLAPGATEQMLIREGVKTGTVIANLATAVVKASDLERIASLECVDYLEVAPRVRRNMDEVKPLVGADVIHQGGGALLQAYKGRDVVVGFVDSGIEYNHVNFRSADCSDFRVKRVWNQWIDGTHPEGFDYGSEYTTEAQMFDAKFDTYELSHGTHVAGIAVGAMQHPDYDFSGMAPEADIVFVALDQNQTAEAVASKVIDGIKYIYDYAASVGKPCVVNLSLGSHEGPHDGTSTFDLMSGAMTGEGRLLVGAVGNEGAYDFHVSKVLQAGGDDFLGTTNRFNFEAQKYTVIDIWGPEGGDISLVPTAWTKTTKELAARLTPLNVDGSEDQPYMEWSMNDADHGLTSSMRAYGEINPNNNKPHIQLIVVNDTWGADNSVNGFEVTSLSGGKVDVWCDYFYSSFEDGGVDGYLNGDNLSTVGEIGGTGKDIIAVGSFVTKPYFRNFGVHYEAADKTPGMLAYFSSKGPTADGRVKPEITAPGEYVVSSLSQYYVGSKYREANVVWNDTKYQVGYMMGSSMSAPVVTGALALWLQAMPDLTPEKARQALAASALNDDFTGDARNNPCPEWGYGKLDALGGLQWLMNGGVSVDTLSYDSMEIDLVANGRDLRVIAPDSLHYNLSVSDLCGVPYLNAVVNGDSNISLASLPKGVCIVTLGNKGKRITKKLMLN